MKTLSIRQPWAAAILAGLKTIETRTWRTAYRGPLLIHAGLKQDYTIMADEVREILPSGMSLVTGAVLGRVTLLDCRPMLTRDEGAALCGGCDGTVAWVLANPVIFETPLVISGHLGLFDVEVPA